MATISKRKRKLSPLPSSSQLRNAMAYVLITAAALFFLNIYTAVSMRKMIFSTQQRSLEDKAQLMTTALLQLDELSAAKVEQAINSLDDLHTTRTVVTDAGGTALYDSLETGNAVGRLVLFPEVVEALAQQDVFRSSYEDSAIESHASIPLVRDGKTLGAVYLMEYNTDLGALISAQQQTVLRISLALEAAVVLISLVFAVAFSRRLRHILQTVRLMRDGDYSHKIRLSGYDELDQLGLEFNDLAERLEASEARRRQFVSDASHELKTPLASIKLLSDSILQNEMDLATEREFVSDIGREADRLGRLSQKLLALTRLDNEVSEEREIVDAVSIVNKVLRMLRPLAKLRDIRIDCATEPGCTIMTVEDDLYQVVFNLVENAIKYNREKGWIGITLRRREDDVELTVSDNGVGIPPDSLPHIFERFYRVEKARSRAAGGAGLGLSIVHDMVQRNFGSIRASAREGNGTVFTVLFPFFEMEVEPQ